MTVIHLAVLRGRARRAGRCAPAACSDPARVRVRLWLRCSATRLYTVKALTDTTTSPYPPHARLAEPPWRPLAALPGPVRASLDSNLRPEGCVRGAEVLSLSPTAAQLTAQPQARRSGTRARESLPPPGYTLHSQHTALTPPRVVPFALRSEHRHAGCRPVRTPRTRDCALRRCGARAAARAPASGAVHV